MFSRVMELLLFLMSFPLCIADLSQSDNKLDYSLSNLNQINQSFSEEKNDEDFLARFEMEWTRNVIQKLSQKRAVISRNYIAAVTKLQSRIIGRELTSGG